MRYAARGCYGARVTPMLMPLPLTPFTLIADDIAIMFSPRCLIMLSFRADADAIHAAAATRYAAMMLAPAMLF